MMHATMMEEQPDDREHGLAARCIDGQSIRVLVAEDSTEMRRLIAGVLRAEGYDVTEARDGMELVDLIEASARAGIAGRYAAIVSDIRMPWLSGMDVLAALDACGFGTPVILITAFGDVEVHEEARALGATAVLDKPFDMERLSAELARATGARGM